ncbi:GntR family transcriptional regulator [Tistrella bauzanensis]|uniref:GntR family transcriptional regulator n=1 Tax=Tistrella arctica TaxID=3133430 RepID=A0ABU9YGJ8_9PROT
MGRQIGGGHEDEVTAALLCHRLEDDIVGGRILPGARLEELALARRFGVSRTPIREALQLLAATELVEKRPNRGVYVTLPAPERLTSMFEAMAELEATCGRLAAERMTPAERGQLDQTHRALGVAMRDGEAGDYEAGNRRFHDQIYAGARSDVLVELTAAVRRRVAPFRRVQFNHLARLGASHHEHQAVVDAILRGDGRAAEAALHRHIMAAHEVAQDFLASLTLAARRQG